METRRNLLSFSGNYFRIPLLRIEFINKLFSVNEAKFTSFVWELFSDSHIENRI